MHITFSLSTGKPKVAVFQNSELSLPKFKILSFLQARDVHILANYGTAIAYLNKNQRQEQQKGFLAQRQNFSVGNPTKREGKHCGTFHKPKDIAEGRVDSKSKNFS